ncbi:MAG: hypothetical protein LBI77_01815 [Puniceicoccales bacterium]|jgi:hypothetical protein|nr:hypothetical protein [Puniceicoccales bacterium]
MLEKKINPLRRGRIQGNGNERQKKSSVGEITDPFSVLNDSISTKSPPEDLNEGDYIPSERIHREAKTTSVDALDPLLDQTEASIDAKKETRNSHGKRVRNTQKESPYPPRDRRHRDRQSESYNGRRTESSNTSQQPSLRSPSEPFHGQCQCDDSKKCTVKHFFCKILEFFGFKSSSNASRCSSKQRNEMTSVKCKSDPERHHSGNSPRDENRNYGRPRRPPSKKS